MKRYKQQKLYYQQNKELIGEKAKLKREAIPEEEKQVLADKRKERWDKSKDKRNEKAICDICGVETSRRQMNKHKQSLKCQSHLPDADRIDNNICCDRCGKSVSKSYMWRHKQTIECTWFPATQLNIPIKVACNMIHELPHTLSFEERLKQICDQYKDGYIEPPKPVKEKKPWQIEREAFDKALQNKEVVLSDGSINPLYQKYFL